MNRSTSGFNPYQLEKARFQKKKKNRKKYMEKATKSLLFSSCSLLMASLFALSASFQFNDPDWYFWIPIYVAAAIVNLANAFEFTSSIINIKTAKSTLWLGLFLFMKVVIEDFKEGIAGIWSLDLRERVVREKFGSGLVVISMFLHLKSSSTVSIHGRIHREKAENLVKYGMALLVACSYGISFVFFVFQKKEMKS